MKGKQKPGVIINMGSAAGLYPMSFDPIYSAAKGLLVCLLFLLICSPLYLFFLAIPFLQAVLYYLLDH